MTTSCHRCRSDEHLTACLDCHTEYCGLCDEDDLNDCERQAGDVCTRCQPEHVANCDDCQRVIADDLREQHRLDVIKDQIFEDSMKRFQQ